MPKTEMRYEPDYAVPPGETLRSVLADLEMTQSDLAARAGLSLKHINQVVQGVAPITHETALLLEKVTGVKSRVWNSLEAAYRDREARAVDTDALATESEWLDELPVKEMIKRGVLTKGADRAILLQEVCRFFGVANRESWVKVWGEPLAAFRKSPTLASDRGAVATWLRLGELDGKRARTAPFDASRFRKSLREIRALTRTSDPRRFIPELRVICANSGVAVVILPEVKGARCWGAARWVTPTKALIQLSLRYKTDDHLWFSFFHEAGHLLLHSKKETFIRGDDVDNVREEEANVFAAAYLIPKQRESDLRGLTTTAEVVRFAEELGIAPGIVVGRLQNDGLIEWRSSLNHLKRRVDFSEAEA